MATPLGWWHYCYYNPPLLEWTGNAIWDQENFDEDTTLQMLDWYYSKNRAV